MLHEPRDGATVNSSLLPCQGTLLHPQQVESSRRLHFKPTGAKANIKKKKEREERERLLRHDMVKYWQIFHDFCAIVPPGYVC